MSFLDWLTLIATKARLLLQKSRGIFSILSLKECFMSNNHEFIGNVWRLSTIKLVFSEVWLVVYSFLKYGWFEINWILIRCTTAHNATVNFFPQEAALLTH